MAAKQVEGARSGLIFYIHFTILAFKNVYGVAIICTMAMQSEKDVLEIPIFGGWE
jgi:hypothetical protein